MIFFDLEFYVPQQDRNKKSGELSANPYKNGHFLLGGIFASNIKYSRKIKDYTISEFWIWKFGTEKEMLRKIYEYLLDRVKNETQKPPIKHIQFKRLIVCGIGISRIDIPYLFARMEFHKIDTKANLFWLLNSSIMPLDLSEMSAIITSKGRQIYPPTKNQLRYKFKLGKKPKQSGKIVWEYYENKEYNKIRERTKGEIEDLIKLYNRVASYKHKSAIEGQN